MTYGQVKFLLYMDFTLSTLNFYNVGHIPYDGEPREEFVTIIAPVTAIFIVLNIGGIIFAVICSMFNAIFHKKR